MPPVRSLAQQFEVTVPTIQRVVARLGAMGLVTAKRGSGIRVNDPWSRGDLFLAPLWFEALADRPDQACAILADFLELRRMVAARLVVRAQKHVEAGDTRIALALARLQNAASLKERAEADLGFTSAVLDVSGQLAARFLFRAVERLVREAPFVAEALYGDAARHRRVLVEVAAAIGAGERTAAKLVEAALERWDARTIVRFKSYLETGQAPAALPSTLGP